MKLLLLLSLFLSPVIEAKDFVYDSTKYLKIKPYIKGTAMNFRETRYQTSRLHSAFSNKSDSELKQVFAIWEDQSKEISKESFNSMPMVFQHAYLIFEDFYQPQNLSRLHQSEKEDEFYKNILYYIIQSKIRIRVTTDIDTKTKHDLSNIAYSTEILDFKPHIKGDAKPLYFNHYYKRVFKSFLGSNGKIMGDFGSQKITFEDSQKRMDFLDTHVKFFRGQDSSIIIPSQPEVTSIIFNKNFTKAKIHFSLFYEGGEAEYEYKNNKWNLMKSELTWIA